MYINVWTAAERLWFHSKPAWRGHDDTVTTDPGYFLAPFIRDLRRWEFCHFSVQPHIQLQRCRVIGQNWNEIPSKQPQTGDREREPWGAATMGLREKSKSACTPLPPPSHTHSPCERFDACTAALTCQSHQGEEENDLTMLSNFAYNRGCHKRHAKSFLIFKVSPEVKKFWKHKMWTKKGARHCCLWLQRWNGGRLLVGCK